MNEQMVGIFDKLAAKGAKHRAIVETGRNGESCTTAEYAEDALVQGWAGGG